MLLLLPLDEIDIPEQLQDAPEPTAAQARCYIATQSGRIGRRRKFRMMPIVVRGESTGRYTVVAGAFRVKLARLAKSTTIAATLCDPSESP
jgi:hypothetical protein